MTQPFPWQSIMQLGLGRLRIPPEQFWAMSPRELSAALAGLLGPSPSRVPLSRREFDGLAQRFPRTHSIKSKGKTNGHSG